MTQAQFAAIDIRLQTGELLAISPVPEPQTWLMWLSGAALLGWTRRHAGAAVRR